MPPKQKSKPLPVKTASSFVDQKSIKEDEDGFLYFTLNNLNVSFANALRRTILTNIPVAVFKTTPYEKDKTTVFVNTGRMHNEILKHRLSCVPIHCPFPDPDILSQYVVECNVKNDSDQILYVTTRDFVLKLKEGTTTTTKGKDDLSRDELFPACPYTNDYIALAVLRPGISKEVDGEHLHFVAEFSIATARDSSMFTPVSTCSYGNTVDNTKVQEVLETKVKEWTDERSDIPPSELEFMKRDWMLLESQRIFIPNSFDFIVQSIGIYTNKELVREGCQGLIRKLRDYIEHDTRHMEFHVSDSTIPNSVDIKLIKTDQTIGKVIEYCLYNGFYMNHSGENRLSFCSFCKKHPHDEDSWIRIAYKQQEEKGGGQQQEQEAPKKIPDSMFLMTARQNVQKCIHDSIQVFENILLAF